MRRDRKPRALVKAIQLRMVRAGHLRRTDVDARWSVKTKRAVKAFQRQHGLHVDGIPGEATWRAFGWRVPFRGSGEKYPYLWRRPGVQWPNDGLCKALNRLGEDLYTKHGKRLVVVSGRRTMAQQWHLYNLWRAGRGNLAAYPNPNAPHIRGGGSAADCGVEDRQGGGYVSVLDYGPAVRLVAKHGLFRQVPSESWHLALRSQW